MNILYRIVCIITLIKAQKFDPYFETDLVDQVLTFNSADPLKTYPLEVATTGSMSEWKYYLLPKIAKYGTNDTITTTLSEGFNNNFMAFDKFMNKLIFHGLTVASVGEWIIRIDLQSTTYPELKSIKFLKVTVNNATTHQVPVTGPPIPYWTFATTMNIKT